MCDSLEAAGIPCWIAPRNIIPGFDWSASIIDAIENSLVMVLVFSAKANDSSQVLREIKSAAEKSIPIVPFRIEDIRFNKSLDYFMGTAHWLDAWSMPAESRFSELANAIKSRVTTGDVGRVS